MDNKIKDAFSQIKAEDELKRSTSAYIRREIEKRQKTEKIRHTAVLRTAICAVAALVVILLGGYLYFTPVSYIAVDVNPSIEMGLNRFEVVVSAKGYNDDGEQLIDETELKNKKYTDAIEELFENDNFQNLLDSGGELVFTVASDNEEEIVQGIQSCGGYGKYHAQCEGTSYEIMEEAHSVGLSAGKYREYLRIVEYDPTITPEECAEMSMKELRELADSYENPDNQTSDDTSSETCEEDSGRHGKGEGGGGGNGKQYGKNRNN